MHLQRCHIIIIRAAYGCTAAGQSPQYSQLNSGESHSRQSVCLSVASKSLHCSLVITLVVGASRNERYLETHFLNGIKRIVMDWKTKWDNIDAVGKQQATVL